MLDKTTYYIERCLFYLSAIAMFLLCFVMMIEVVFRYIPSLSIAQPWVPGVLSLIDIWLIFMGSVVAMRAGGHLKINFFTSRMPPSLARANKIFVNFINLILLIIMTYYSLPIVETGMDLTFGGVPFSKGYSFMALPICSSIMALMVIRNIVNAIIEKKSES